MRLTILRPMLAESLYALRFQSSPRCDYSGRLPDRQVTAVLLLPCVQISDGRGTVSQKNKERLIFFVSMVEQGSASQVEIDCDLRLHFDRLVIQQVGPIAPLPNCIQSSGRQ